MPIVRIEMLPGRSIAQERELALVITDAICAIAHTTPEATTVLFTENSVEDGRPRACSTSIGTTTKTTERRRRSPPDDYRSRCRRPTIMCGQSQKSGGPVLHWVSRRQAAWKLRRLFDQVIYPISMTIPPVPTRPSGTQVHP